MSKIYKFAVAVALAGLIMPATSFAAAAKTFTGTVIGINGSQIIFSTVSAAKYAADAGNAQLTRKNGAIMQFLEILIGDKVQVTGTLWADNSISAAAIKDMSLYAHSGTFTGKITAINTADSSFVIESKTFGRQTIHTNNFTSFSTNGANSGFSDLQLGYTAAVKGVWDRSSANVVASAVNASFRMIAIYFTGSLSAKNGLALTVVGNGNVIYGVDVSKISVLNKNGKPITLNQYNLGDVLRVWGKHISGMVAVVATEVKDNDITK